MRKSLVCLLLAVRPVLGDEPLTFDDLLRRSLLDPRAANEIARLAHLEAEAAGTGTFTAEGPTFEADAGTRRDDSDAWKPQAGVRVEVPLLAHRDARATAVESLEGDRELLASARTVESRLRLRTVYLDAWAAQSRLAALREQADVLEALAASVRARVEHGADASYESALVDGEMLRARSEIDLARAELGGRWADLRALADLPDAPLPVAPPEAPRLVLPDDAARLFESGLLRRAVERRAALEAAFAGLDLAKGLSRWSIGGALGTEADEAFAVVGVGFRMRRSGEAEALERESELALAALRRSASAEADALATRFRVAADRVAGFGSLVAPESFDAALRAVSLRIELGKERPSEALPVRRQLLEARAAALARIRDACALDAEIEALTAGDLP